MELIFRLLKFTTGTGPNVIINYYQKNLTMNNLRNSVRLIGNLGANPEVKSLEKGNKVARFSIATNDSYIDKDGKKVTDTQWHNIVAWGKAAELVEEYLSKGSEIALEGKLTSRSYESKDGEKKYFTEIVMAEMVMLGKKPTA